MAVDWLSGSWYFSDEGREALYVCSPSLAACRLLLHAHLSKLRGLALDPAAGSVSAPRPPRPRPRPPRTNSALPPSPQAHVLVGVGREPGRREPRHAGGRGPARARRHQARVPGGAGAGPGDAHALLGRHLPRVRRARRLRRPQPAHCAPRLLGQCPARPLPRSPAPPLTVPPADGVVALRVQTQKLQHISVLEETLYLPVWSESSVAAVSRYSRDSRRTDISLSARPSAVLVYHRQRQPAAAHPCGVSGVPGVPGVLGAGCDHICVGEPVPAPGGGLRARCLCRHGYRLAGHGSCLREYTLRRGTEPRLRWGHTATPGTCALQAWSWTRTWWWHAGCRRWCRRCRWRRKTRRGSGKARRRR